MNDPAAAAFVPDRKSPRCSYRCAAVSITSVQLISCLQEPPFPCHLSLLPHARGETGNAHKATRSHHLVGFQPPQAPGHAGNSEEVVGPQCSDLHLMENTKNGTLLNVLRGKMDQVGTTAESGGHRGNPRSKQTKCLQHSAPSCRFLEERLQQNFFRSGTWEMERLG